MDHDEVQTVVAAGAAALVVIQLILLDRQLRLNRQTARADHDRRQKQATLDAFHDLIASTAEAARSLRGAFGGRKLTHKEARELRGLIAPTPQDGSSDSSGWLANEKDRLRGLETRLREYLNGLERLAVGVTVGAYNAEVLHLCGYTMITRLHSRFEEYIKLLRSENDPETGEKLDRAYSALDDLVATLNALEPPARPSIDAAVREKAVIQTV